MIGSDVVTGAFTLAAVALTALIGGVRRRHDERLRERDERRRHVTELIVAAEHLHDAVRLFRAITIARRTAIGGIATGIAHEAPEFADIGTDKRALAVRAIVGLRDYFKIGGVLDQMQDHTGAKYQEIVTPPLQRLIAAATAVQLEQPGQLAAAARKLQDAAGGLADNAQAMGRGYGRAESRFKRALDDVGNAAGARP